MSFHTVISGPTLQETLHGVHATFTDALAQQKLIETRNNFYIRNCASVPGAAPIATPRYFSADPYFLARLLERHPVFIAQALDLAEAIGKTSQLLACLSQRSIDPANCPQPAPVPLLHEATNALAAARADFAERKAARAKRTAEALQALGQKPAAMPTRLDSIRGH